MREHQGLDVSPCRRLPDDLKAHVSLRRLSRDALLLSRCHDLPLTGFERGLRSFASRVGSTRCVKRDELSACLRGRAARLGRGFVDRRNSTHD